MTQKFSYEKAIAEIEGIIDDIENQTLDVDALADKVKRVALLVKNCKKKLSDTRSEVDNLLKETE